MWQVSRPCSLDLTLGLARPRQTVSPDFNVRLQGSSSSFFLNVASVRQKTGSEKSQTKPGNESRLCYRRFNNFLFQRVLRPQMLLGYFRRRWRHRRTGRGRKPGPRCNLLHQVRGSAIDCQFYSAVRSGSQSIFFFYKFTGENI